MCVSNENDPFKSYKQEVENFKNGNIKYLQTDNGTEYCNQEFEEFLKKSGIQRRLSAPYTPQQNGLTERKNRSLQDKARCLLIEAKLPMGFWAEAIITANYLLNRCPSSSIEGKTPFELWVGRSSSIRHLQ
ncbi:Hydra magnipapillata [Nesidiocoris tenuis]|uniref:Hydra magnipapillata n=1 Tax=Nesidiocoris tenuis TaxID=355587 RepID=A0ABN7AS98_9HEMI|nr:Hydra magnipapillata [Nesidiocoris tenuis]